MIYNVILKSLFVSIYMIFTYFRVFLQFPKNRTKTCHPMKTNLMSVHMIIMIMCLMSLSTARGSVVRGITNQDVVDKYEKEDEDLVYA